MFQSNEQAILEYKNVLFIWLFQLPFFWGGYPLRERVTFIPHPTHSLPIFSLQIFTKIL